MTLAEAQHEMRTVFVRGAVGQTVSGAIWLLSAALATWGTAPRALLSLAGGGVFIFPITQLALRLSGRPYRLSAGNPLGALATQVALTVPFTLPVAFGATLHNLSWFYPAVMMLVGAHYLPFVFLYGMWEFAALGAALLAGGAAIGWLRPHDFALGGWIAAALLLLFAAYAAATRRTAGAA